MANTIDYSTIFQGALDTQMVQQSTSGWMEANAGSVQYNGGKEVKIPKLVMDGLGNYDRTGGGYPVGSYNFSYETMTMTQDRAKQFLLDSMDVNETNFALNASSAMSEFQKAQVIPEVDAYRYSKIAQLAIAKGTGYVSGGYTPTAADIYSKLKADIATVQDRIGAVPLIISMTTMTKAILEGSTEITRQLPIVDFVQGAISSKLTAIDDCPIVTVPSIRFKTLYDFADGRTTGQTAGGFKADAAAKTINWIVSAQNCPIAISKTDSIRIYDPTVVQDQDGYKIDYRKYHDLWIPDNKMDGIFVNIKEALA